MLAILLFFSFIVGVAVGIFTFRFDAVRAKKGLPILIKFTPFLLVFLLELFFPDTTEILYASLVFATAVFFSWSYLDIKNTGE